MTELLVAFEKRTDMTTDELREYYHDEHVPIVTDLPNLTGYEVTFPSDPDRSPYDGIARLQFPDGAAMAEAMDTEVADRMEEDAANFADPESLIQIVGETEDLLED